MTLPIMETASAASIGIGEMPMAERMALTPTRMLNQKVFEVKIDLLSKGISFAWGR